MADPQIQPVDEKLPTGRLDALGMQHVRLMCAGAMAVPPILGRALKLRAEQVAMVDGAKAAAQAAAAPGAAVDAADAARLAPVAGVGHLAHCQGSRGELIAPK
jgi:hypothetical protein